MPPEFAFPRSRHLELAEARDEDAAAEAEALALAEAARAVIVSFDPRAVPSATLAAAAGTPPTLPRPPEGASPQPAPSRILRALRVDLSRPRREEEICLDERGERAGGAYPVRCASSLEGREHAASFAAQAAREGDAIVLSGLGRWYDLGPRGAGSCGSCEQALLEALRGTYGEHVQRFPIFSRTRTLAPSDRPFAEMRAALRLSEPLEAAKRAVLRARDAARRERGLEISVLGEAGPVSALSLLLCRHLDGLLFSLPSADPLEALLPLLAARAALGERAAVAVAPAGATAAQTVQLAALAAACDADLMLPKEGAVPEARTALAAHRRYLQLVRERYRPAAPLADLELCVSPRGDHFSEGTHLAATSLVAATLSAAQIQVAVRMDGAAAGAPRSRIVALAGCAALPEEVAKGLRRHVEGGGDLLLVGPCSVVDDEGRVGEPVFPDAKQGLDRSGEGRIWAIAPEGPLPPSSALAPLVLRAARELLGRGKQTLSLAGRGALLTRAYLDPERKLDVHLVNLDLRPDGFGPAQGLTLHIAGQAAGAGRTGYWFAPDRGSARDGERIALNPSGFSVSTVLPSLGACALLAVPR